MATPLRSPILTTPRVRHRKSTEKLRSDQLKALRKGFVEIKKLSDTNGVPAIYLATIAFVAALRRTRSRLRSLARRRLGVGG